MSSERGGGFGSTGACGGRGFFKLVVTKEAQEEEDESSEAAPKPPDTSSLPASFHVVAAEDRTKIASEVVSYCTPAQFWRTTFSDDSKALRTQFLETEMHCWNVNIGRWAPHPDLGICRLTTYEVDTHAPIGPQQTRVLEYEAVDRDGELARFTHRSVVRILDATFGDHYQVETTVSVDEKTGGGTAYSMEFGIHFSKRIPMWGIEALVRNTWKAKNTASAKVYLGMAKKQLLDAPPLARALRPLLADDRARRRDAAAAAAEGGRRRAARGRPPRAAVFRARARRHPRPPRRRRARGAGLVFSLEGRGCR